ncbi:MAG: hypothetical protein R2754_13845 [Microthrixaceae bacterium]
MNPSTAKPRATRRLATGLVGAVLMVATACNPTVPPLVYASDIGVADIGGGTHVVAALAADGSVTTTSVFCTSLGCALTPWSSLGGNLTSLQVDATSPGHVVVVGLAPGGATWFRRGACTGTDCTWTEWTKLGGKLATLRSEQSATTQCVNLAGLTSTNQFNAYRASICEDGTTGWASAHGAVLDLEVNSSGTLFGPRFHGHMFVRKVVGNQVSWPDIGGSTSDPATNPVDPTEQCGLSTGSRRLWCHSSSGWAAVGGTWAKLDDGTTIGVADDGSVLDWRGGAIENSGGNMSEVAREGNLQVAITTGGVPQFRDFRNVSNTWQNL